ncbi:hypothetical protein K2173_003075 [Erythroxylum novogranatense]|uniref:GDSL esterase/lipase n=1 Tax=Erythroxylum novogranatense TaxID=1862640 RepID=A0AAV8TA92_9ROSI|nr:hypothetical protein K2173_003075 [Erythroxylum novogranatense]
MAKNTFLMIFFGGLTLIFTSSLQVLEAQMVSSMFIFGDSLVDVGNNNHLPLSVARANFPPNGIDFPNKKATGRFSNGKNAADIIAEKLGLPSSPPYLSLPPKNASSAITGINFASGGAGIFNGSDQVLGQSLPLTQQVGYYESVYEEMVKKIGRSRAQSQISKSLMVIVTGSNDLFGYSDSAGFEKSNTPLQYLNLMALTLKGLVKRIHETGARKFLFTGVGPIGCAPGERVKNKTEECNEVLNSMALSYNKVLKSMLQELTSEFQGLSYTYFDTYSNMLNLIQKPSTYGFREFKAACCGLGDLKANVPCLPIATYCSNRKDHVFWDPYHPTEAASRILVDTLFDGPSEYSFPVNLRQLLAA